MQEIIMEYVQEKTSTDGLEMMKYLLEMAQDAIKADPDFKKWVADKKAELAAQRTPEALDAQKEAIRQQIVEREAKYNLKGVKNGL